MPHPVSLFSLPLINIYRISLGSSEKTKVPRTQRVQGIQCQQLTRSHAKIDAKQAFKPFSDGIELT
ncbi:MAG: hypothetical protein EAZ21_13045 [Betaproteobacteria bacterium]|nr:MAG: hypothetical protein EAZ21_13045 [Betaproteobacteria bacterium]